MNLLYVLVSFSSITCPKLEMEYLQLAVGTHGIHVNKIKTSLKMLLFLEKNKLDTSNTFFIQSSAPEFASTDVDTCRHFAYRVDNEDV